MSRVGPQTTSFAVRGFRNGSVVSLTWDEGALSGDPPTIDLIEIEIELAFVARGDPNVARSASPLADTDGDALADPQAALRLIRHVLDRVTEVVPRSEAHA